VKEVANVADKEREQYLKTIAELSATVAELTKQVAELQEALNAKKRRKDSHNSSQPPLSGESIGTSLAAWPPAGLQRLSRRRGFPRLEGVKSGKFP
jgi:hypothetical protein